MTQTASRRALAIRLAAGLITIIISLPLLLILAGIFTPDAEVWSHLRQFVLPGLVRNTILLTLGVVLGAGTLGVSLAWLSSQYYFPLSNWFRWLLMLPLAMPAYVLAFVQVGLLDYTGPVQSALRGLFGESLPVLQIRSLGGAMMVLSLSFYPYVFLLARNAFESQGMRHYEVAQTLGISPGRAFFRLALPMARPWIASGLLLVTMESLADFGAVYILGVDTLSIGIYQSWFALFSLPAAFQLASLLLLAALALLLLEQKQRAQRRYFQTPNDRPAGRRHLSPVKRWLAFSFATGVLLAAFVVPLLQLLSWTIGIFSIEWDSRYIQFLSHSLLLAMACVVLVLAAGLLIAYQSHRFNDPWSRMSMAICTVGYGIPGAVLAVAVFSTISQLDRLLVDGLGLASNQLLVGTVLATLAGLSIRFMSVGVAPLASGFARISPSLEQTARSLGSRGFDLIRRLYLPLLQNGLITAALLVFVDVMKEMPITLMTRPFGLNTLSIRIFELTSEGEWQRAALPAVTLVVVGLIPAILLARRKIE